METKELLKSLIAFPTVSSESNLELIKFIQALLATKGIESQLVFNKERTKAAMYASIGPADKAGILFSGHSDVVPVTGQIWDTDPFVAVEKDGKLFGRGSCDMKGFIASAVNTLLTYADKPLTHPVHLAISFDEELGCLGVKELLLQLQRIKVEPYLCIVGEPTSMNVAIGHKGKTSYCVDCYGDEGHSSQAPSHTNAIYLACDMITQLRQLQTQFIEYGNHDTDYNVPYSTVHVGTIHGGRALNIVPGQCQFEFEIRHLPGDDVLLHLSTIFEHADRLVKDARKKNPQSKSAIEFQCLTNYPGLHTVADNPAVQQLVSLASKDSELLKVAFGTEGGLFADYLSSPVVVCGPGSIDQAHKANEFLTVSQLNQCDELLSKVVLDMCFKS